MSQTAQIIKKSLKDVGLIISETETVPGEYYAPAFEILKDLIAELNTQSAIIFSQQSDVVSVGSNKLIFKPLNETEQSIIDGGGTVDLTGRLIDFIPLTNPIVYYKGSVLDYASYRDLLNMPTSHVMCYAFNIAEDYSEIIFNAPVDSITLLRNVPIVIDDEPYGDVHIPKAYEHFLITKLSEALAIRYQFAESASMFAQKAERTGNILATNATSRRPVRRNLMAGLNKFK